MVHMKKGVWPTFKAFGFSEAIAVEIRDNPPSPLHPRIHLLDYTHVSSSIRLNLFSSFLRSPAAFYHLKFDIFFFPIPIWALVFWQRPNCVPFRHACKKAEIWFSQNKKKWSNTGKKRKFHSLRCFSEIIHRKTWFSNGWQYNNTLDHHGNGACII